LKFGLTLNILRKSFNIFKMDRIGISFVAITAATSEQSSLHHSSNPTIKMHSNGNISTLTSETVRMAHYDKNVSQAVEVLRRSDIVCFDVDSTVIKEEGIDELAKFCGKGAEVERLTREAMGGSMTFQEALRRRLNIIRPSQRQIGDFLRQHPSTITPGLRDLVNKLKSEGKQVYLISGGFDCLIEPVANSIGVPLNQMYANQLLFTFNGEYAGFDMEQPTSRSGGKGVAIDMIRKLYDEDKIITMIGDGATDMEAAPAHANHFIGFGGNVVRDSVQKNAKYFATDFKSLMW